MSMIEKTIIRKMATDAIAKGWTVSVEDGEEWTLKRSKEIEAVMNAVMTTDEDRIRFREADGTIVGTVYLVYGNSGYDVINDYTTGEAMEAFMKTIEEFASKWDR